MVDMCAAVYVVRVATSVVAFLWLLLTAVGSELVLWLVWVQSIMAVVSRKPSMQIDSQGMYQQPQAQIRERPLQEDRRTFWQQS
jgi:hypothetical protein